jgi:RimJ/RimL family protein N-acetyltransferase
MSMEPLYERVPERLVTDRLIIRCARGSDAAAVNAAICESMESLRVYMLWAQTEPTLVQSEAECRRMQAKFLLREDLPMMMFERLADDSEGRFVGGAGLHRNDWTVRRFEIGYWCRTSARGRGLVTEAAAAMERMAFEELGALRVELRTDVTNTASWRIAERLGFTLEGILRSDGLNPRGEPRSTRVYSKVKT